MKDTQTDSIQLNELFAEEWEFRLQENSIAATLAGDHRYDDRLPSVTEANFERRYRQYQLFLGRLAAIDPDPLPSGERLNYRIFQNELENQIADYEFKIYLMPISKLDGIHTTIPELINYMPFNTAGEYENYIARLNAVNTYAQQQIDLMRAGLRHGYTPARTALEGIEDSLQGLIVTDPAKSLFYKPFRQFPPEIQEVDRGRLREAGEAAIRASVVPAYQALREYLLEEYIPGARQEPGAFNLPNGQAYYAHCVRSFTTTNMTPDQIHATGLAEVERIRSEMESILRKTGFEGSFPEFIDFLRTDERFYAHTPEALLEKVALILKRMDGELPRLFKKHPRTPYGIQRVPDHIAPHTTTAYYFPPPGDGTRAGFYYVNTYDLKSRPLYELEALSLHEAVPGHHTQLALQIELEEVPKFRQFSNVTAFIEGWALYAERLGLEVGFYQDPYSDFGRLTYEMWRACRLVVDTGIHALAWTRQQAIDFMAANTALTLLNITNEVDRYIAWPGQALAYKIGELKIRELRARAEQELGSRFDLREFHDRLLEHGAIPLDALAVTIEHWIAEKQTG